MAPAVLAFGLLGAERVHAQELEPRAYTPAPIGTTILLSSIGRSKGAIVFDPGLDVSDVQADLGITTFGAGYTFGLAGRQARVLAVFPIAWGRISGDVGQLSQHQDVAGLVDPRFKLSVGLRGAPALTLSEFASMRARTTIGTSLTIAAPFGQYAADRLVNLGYHRWGFKPEIGMSRTFGRWTIDGSAGAWIFTSNDAYFPAHAIRTQSAIASAQLHVSRLLPKRFWVAIDATGFAGGQTRVDRQRSPDRQRNGRLGATLSMPLARQQSIKLSCSSGTLTRRGADFDTVTVTWQLVSFR